ncbi:MAG: Histidine kinase [Parcubacteria group bacterium GW2011_GWA2_47_21]|nr:MAG: Histidine kinase [Parcubacteria group bacterium GW2011_GWA2_47_21]
MVTHKFRTPLTYIKWSAEALRATSDEERRKESLSRINQATEKMVDLTETLIGLTDYDSSAHLYKIEPVDLEVLAAEATMGLSNQLKDKNIALSAEISKDLAARADYRRLQSVIHTLVENAITYTPANGKIEILGNEENGKVALSIKDSGIGLSREEIHHIFDKFFRGKRARATDTEGLGVGLYVARNIMDRLGGEITAESAGENKGATFTLRLPMAKVTKEKMNK